MGTMREVKSVCCSTIMATQLFGCEEDFSLEFHTRLSAIGKSVCEEQGYVWGSPGIERKIELDKPLGGKSQILFQELKQWLKDKNL